jgi:hypothetical protein
MYLEHESAEHGLLFSDWIEFAIEPGEVKDLSLELKPARRFVGRLDRDVPRPVVDGRVHLHAEMQRQRFTAGLMRDYEVPVHSDGTFAIEGLPVADAHVVALCRGWCSRREARSMCDEGNPSGASTEWTLQSVDLRTVGDEFVIAMEPTATLEVELRAPDGSPLIGAKVAAAPNRHCRLGSSLFLGGHDWSAITDANGIARIQDIPTGFCSFRVLHDRYDIPNEPSDNLIERAATRERYASFPPGSTVRRSYVLERKRQD